MPSHIAIIDDNPDIRLLLLTILKKKYLITEYESGFAALAHMPEHPPDLVLLDISMPRLDGLEVLQRMRQDACLRHIPVVAITASSEPRSTYLAHGFNDHLAKPLWEQAQLFQVIANWLPTASA